MEPLSLHLSEKQQFCSSPDQRPYPETRRNSGTCLTKSAVSRQIRSDFFFSADTAARAQQHPVKRELRCVAVCFLCSNRLPDRFISSLWCSPANMSAVTQDHDDFFERPPLQEGGGRVAQPLTLKTPGGHCFAPLCEGWVCSLDLCLSPRRSETS